ncbi:MAG TPA: hypothetical protein ENK76_04345, partial [Campylobacterales bacterium]|nr:hypothetical protein [Campylobacterales bacterium]
MEIADDGRFETDKHVTLPFEPKSIEKVKVQELSILQSLVDNNFLQDTEYQEISESTKARVFIDQILLENIFYNQNILEEHNIEVQTSTIKNLEFIADGLRELNITELVKELDNCDQNNAQDCRNLIIETDDRTEINQKDAEVIKETNSTSGTTHDGIAEDNNKTIVVNSDGNVTINNSNSEDNNSSSSSTSEDSNSSSSSTSEDSNSSSSSDSDGSSPSQQKTEKNVADGYIIKLITPASAYCSSNSQTYQSSLDVGAKGLITFNNIALSSDCKITIPSNAIIDSDNDGNYNQELDKPLGFPMQSYANTQYISPLTTLVIEKKLRGENTDALEDMVKDFDPVIAGTTILSKTGEEKNKIQKLIILMETVKNAKRQSYPIGNIDVSSIINTNISDTIDSFNINTLSNGFPTNVQTKTDIMKRIMTLIDDLDTNHLNINSFLINISDAGKNIKDSIKSSFIGTLPSDDNELYQAIIKSSSDVSAISYELDSLNNSIELLKIPTANAGFDRNITEGKPSIFDASGSVDFDGSIVSYEWREGNSVLSTNISFTKNDFSLGEHNITLTVVDDINNSDSDLLTIMVLPNKPPVANAGADKIAMIGDSVLFDAGLSSDSDGNIISYQWEDNGTILSHSVTFSTTNLPQGTHHILLTVVDDSNASSQDEVVVTISERQRTNKKSVDGYIIKIPSPAIALCSNGQSYQSSLTVGAKGAILFDRVELTDDCIIT